MSLITKAKNDYRKLKITPKSSTCRKNKLLKRPTSPLQSIKKYLLSYKKQNGIRAVQVRDIEKNFLPLRKLVKSQFLVLAALEESVQESKTCNFQLQAALKSQKMESDNLNQRFSYEKTQNRQLLEMITNSECAILSGEEESQVAMSFIKSKMFETMEPVLMNQRFEELECSYRQCELNLDRKKKLIEALRNEKEEIQMKYEHLMDEYCKEQRRFEIVCSKYMALQARKKEQSFLLKNALSEACACIINAKKAFSVEKNKRLHYQEKFDKKFDTFFEYMMKCTTIHLNPRNHISGFNCEENSFI